MGTVDNLLKKLSEIIGVGRQRESNIVSKEELDEEYFNFFRTFGSIFIVGAYVGFKRHMLSRKLDNIIGMLLRRKLFSEILSKNYSLFIGKNINASTVTQKTVTNVELVTTDLMMIFTSFTRSASFAGVGSVMMIYYLPQFTLMTTCLLGALAVSAKWFNSKVYEASKKRTESMTHLSSFVGD